MNEVQGAKLRNASFELLAYDLHLNPPKIERPLRLLLDSDLAIGAAEHTPEHRVGCVPEQVKQLMELFKSHGVKLTVNVVSGAGRDVGYQDADYEAAGASIVKRDDLGSMTAPDIVHALKEPAEHEAMIPGPFLRIGALHLPNRPSGVEEIVRRKNFAAVFDGGAIGNHSYRFHGGYARPIVASMAYYAGYLSARQIGRHFADSHALKNGTIVIAGGGAAGAAAAEEALRHCARVKILEPFAERAAALRIMLDHGRVDVIEEAARGETLKNALRDAVGVVFAIPMGVSPDEKVIGVEDLGVMHPEAVIADIGIDQGGSIRVDGLTAGADAAEQIRQLRDHFDKTSRIYFGEVNMPRRDARAAAYHHGHAVLPYLAALLVLSGIAGGPQAAVAKLMQDQGKSDTNRYLDLLVRDLMEGLALTNTDGTLGTQGVKPHQSDIRDWLMGAWDHQSPS